MRNGVGRLGLVRHQFNFVGLLYDHLRAKTAAQLDNVAGRGQTALAASSALSAAYSARLYDDACHAFEVYKHN